MKFKVIGYSLVRSGICDRKKGKNGFEFHPECPDQCAILKDNKNKNLKKQFIPNTQALESF